MDITTIIVGITAIASIISFYKREYFYRFQYNPFLVKSENQWYRIFTHAFIHGDWIHLLVNMYVLYNFGRITELFYAEYFGATGQFLYVGLYIGGIMFAALPALKKHQNNSYYNAVGASGAVAAVLFASILFMPSNTLYIFGVLPIPAFLFGFLYLFLEAYLDKRSNDNIAHDAHLWGALFGSGFTIAMEPSIVLSFIDSVNEYVNNLL